MAKVDPNRVHQVVVGFFQPHAPVDWTGEMLNLKTGELVKEESMTKQSFKEECDINNIVKKFEAGQAIEHINRAAAEGLYIDLPDPMDFQEALSIAQHAQDAFAALPAHVRARFQNNPQKFLEFTGDARNQEEMIKLGLATDSRPGPPPAPQRVEIVNGKEPPKSGKTEE